jgi:Na+/melibiose symporter-like transporter
VSERTEPRTRWGLLRDHDFRQLFLAESTSQLGAQVSALALPLIVAVSLHASVLELAVVSTAESLPFLLVSLPAGVLVDRGRRRRLMIWCDLVRALALTTIPVAWWAGRLTVAQVAVVAFAVGVGTAIFDVAYQSVLPRLVTPDRLVEGNAKLEGVGAVSQVAGPAAAGLLIRYLTAPFAVLLDASSFLASAVLLGRIRRPDSRAGDRPSGSVLTQVVDGLRYVWRHRVLRAVAATSALVAFFSAMNVVVLLFLLSSVLRLDPAVIGLVGSLISVGALAGALLATTVTERFGESRTLRWSLAVTGPFGFVLPLVTPGLTLWLGAGAFAVAVAGSVIFNINQVSLRQRTVPGDLLGRVNATMRFVNRGSAPPGSLAGGALGASIGGRPTLWIAAIGGFLAFLPLVLPGARRPDPDR